MLLFEIYLDYLDFRTLASIIVTTAAETPVRSDLPLPGPRSMYFRLDKHVWNATFLSLL